ncbi:cytosolic arginine sensor for mTORC1 subunit 1 isoform X2 [Sceloporus undulatus]|uniref:cytosolic arginine sensor for mTORC1 subunit 1 isoform X2 n=1 Tax=Sceloporus undulatus TaxID=8520 RepID=UPI001C4C3173|nr:cytosolic arginine sensor for mTORC1 subunit 1 isoform X2 [Sceloporus undulatus]
MFLRVETDAVSNGTVHPLRKDNSLNRENSAAAVAAAVKGTPFLAYLFTLGAMQIPPRCKFFSLTETPEDYTIILDEEGFKELPASEFLQAVESAWLVLNVSSNGSASAGIQPIGVTKIAKSVIGPLAQHSVSVLMLSTYQTDFILVREKDLPVVIHTLANEFEIYQEVNGEPVPAKCDDATNGFVRPKQVSANVHPFQSPPNRFCILSVAPETLPAIATILLDVLFYSHSAAKESASLDGGSGGGAESFAFFAFSLIEGYISIVMDAETKEKFPSDLLLTSSSGELWRMVRIGGQPLGFDECGIVAQIAEPLADADISAYYISTFNFDHALVPEEGIDHVTEVLQKRQESRR